MECPLHTPETGAAAEGIISFFSSPHPFLFPFSPSGSTSKPAMARYHGLLASDLSIYIRANIAFFSPFFFFFSPHPPLLITAKRFPELNIASEGGEWGPRTFFFFSSPPSFFFPRSKVRTNSAT